MALIAKINEFVSSFANTSFGPIELEKHQILFENVYVKVETVFSNKIEATATVSYAYQNSKLSNRSFIFPLNLEGHNPIKQAYEYLKTLPEFANATDC